MTIDREEFVSLIVDGIIDAVTSIPDDVARALEEALEREDGLARRILENIIKAVEISKSERIPLCQDTGIPIFFVRKGGELDLEFDLRDALREAVVRATKMGFLRSNTVHPISRAPYPDNMGPEMPIVHLEEVDGDGLEIVFLPKGAGSENVSKLYSLRPVSGREEIVKAVLGAILEAGGKPCPPTILGIGIGGTTDLAMLLAKRSLLRRVGERNEDEEIAELELEILERANELGLGPMGLGGRTTCLDVRIEIAASHTASLFLGVNFQCWAARISRISLR